MDKLSIYLNIIPFEYETSGTANSGLFEERSALGLSSDMNTN